VTSVHELYLEKQLAAAYSLGQRMMNYDDEYQNRQQGNHSRLSRGH